MVKERKSNLDYISPSLYTQRGIPPFPMVSYERGWKADREIMKAVPTSYRGEIKNSYTYLEDNIISIGGLKKNLPKQLKDVAIAIEEAKYILNFKEDWDDFGANATDLHTFMKAVDFVITYATDLLKYGQMAKPFIDIMRDGSISVFWENSKATLLIIFKKGSLAPSYMYGEEKKSNGNIPFKYAIENSVEIDEIVSKWLSWNLI